MIIPDNLLHTISFIAAVVACVIIVKAFLSHKQEDDKKNLHLYYISGITIFIIIELATYIFVHNDNSSNLLNTISFASTLSSIVLSVVAIVHGIVTARRGAEDVANSIKASQELKLSADNIKEISSSFSNSMSKSSKEIESSVTKVHESITFVDNGLKELKKQFQELIRENKTGFDKVSEKLDGINEGSRENKISNKSDRETFLHLSSFSGCIAIYACYKASKEKTELNLRELSTELHQQFYYYGYIVAASALALLDANIDDAIVKDIKIHMNEDEINILKNKILEFNIKDNAEFAEEKKKLLEFLGLN